REHQRLVVDLVVAGRGALLDGPEPDLVLADLSHARLEHLLDRPGQVIVRARVGLADDLAETQDDATLVRGAHLDAGREPPDDPHERDDVRVQPTSAGPELRAERLERFTDFGERILR